MWAAGFVPEFKQLVAPIEKLLRPGSDGTWTQECTGSANKLVKVIFSKITLFQGDPCQPLHVYPSLGQGVGFVAVTQMQQGEERPVACLSRQLSKSEMKWGALEQQVALVSWALRKARRYSCSVPEVVVKLE